MKVKVVHKGKQTNRNLTLLLILFHILLGFLTSLYRPVLMVYFFLVFGYFLIRIVTHRGKSIEILQAAAYLAGAEVFFRMGKAFVFYETGKYAVILIMLLGMFYQGFKKHSIPFMLYLLLLIPGVYVSYIALDYETEFRQTILFNLSGPLCLAITAIYCFTRSIQFKDLLKILDAIIYPLISMTVYIYLYNPDVSEVITGTASTSATTGGYGPNQVATMLGLGFFILYTRLLIPYKNRIVHFIMMFFLMAMVYRALLSFSRGGVLVATIMIVAFSVILYTSTSLKTKFRISYKVIGVAGAVFAIWLYAVLQTGGMLANRYANEDALGREKEDVTTGRSRLFMADIEAFESAPVTGIGVGQVKSYYIENLGINLPSHNEVARMLSEHGLLGVFALLIVLIIPLVSKMNGRKNIFFYPFFIFWFLTISHSAMRIAAPAFIYGLCLLNLTYKNEKTKATLHRK